MNNASNLRWWIAATLALLAWVFSIGIKADLSAEIALFVTMLVGLVFSGFVGLWGDDEDERTKLIAATALAFGVASMLTGLFPLLLTLVLAAFALAFIATAASEVGGKDFFWGRLTFLVVTVLLAVPTAAVLLETRPTGALGILLADIAAVLLLWPLLLSAEKADPSTADC